MFNLIVGSILKTMRNYGMTERGDRVLIAVSGGPDSILLQRMMAHLKKKLGIEELCVANMDHNLRGTESRRDSIFVKKIAKEAGLKCFFKKIDKSVYRSKSGLSTEEVARQVRYEFLLNTARRQGCNVIATGHTLDDQAETILMRIIKGASLKGLAGIAPVRIEEGIRIIRPLIELEKKEICRYLDESSISYRIDSSNEQPVYFRNIVRAEILPFLEKYNPKFKRALFSMTEHLREDFDFIAKEKEKAHTLLGAGRKGGPNILLKDIVLQPKALQKEIIRDRLDSFGAEVKKLSFRHWKEIDHMLRHKGKGSSIDLPGSVRLSRTESELVFTRI